MAKKIINKMKIVRNFGIFLICLTPEPPVNQQQKSIFLSVTPMLVHCAQYVTLAGEDVDKVSLVRSPSRSPRGHSVHFMCPEVDRT